MSKVPHVVVWSDPGEVDYLHSLLFSKDRDAVSAGLSKINALSTRGQLPTFVESTGFIVSAIYNDIPEVEPLSTRLAYSMALVKFVNALLDPSQKSQFAIPLHLLATNIKLPSFFVELRHAATHESLPSLELLRETAVKALHWLDERCWSIGNTEDEDSNGENAYSHNVKDALRKWREYQRPASSKAPKKDLKNSEDLLRDFEDMFRADADSFVNVLYTQNVLIPKNSDFRAIPSRIRLYSPIIDRLRNLGAAKSVFIYGMAELRNGGGLAKDDVSQRDYLLLVSEWVKYLMTPRDESEPWLDDPEALLEEFLDTANEYIVDILNAYISENPSCSNKIRKISNQLSQVLQSSSSSSIERPKRCQVPVLNDIESEISSFKKRLLEIQNAKREFSKSEKCQWSKVNNWSPRPIGTL